MSDALNKLGQTEVIRQKISTGRGPSNKLVSKPALYMLVMRSDKPEAIRFQEWIAQVVLPAIEKDGGYILGEEKVSSGEMDEDELILKAMEVMQPKIECLREENAGMREELTSLTIQKWNALNELYLSQSQKGRLTSLAKAIFSAKGVKVERLPRTYTDRFGRTFGTVNNVHPRTVIDEAALMFGFIEAPRRLYAA